MIQKCDGWLPRNPRVDHTAIMFESEHGDAPCPLCTALDALDRERKGAEGLRDCVDDLREEMGRLRGLVRSRAEVAS